MTTANSQRTGRINLRVDPDLEDRLRAAADLYGETLTGFLLAAGAERAAEVLERGDRIAVKDATFRRFVAALAEPAEPMPTVTAYVAEPSPIPAG